MSKKLLCENCNKSFAPSKDQVALIEKMVAKDAALVALECANCGVSMFLELKPVEQGPLYRCPCSGCTGWVCFVEGHKKAKMKEPSFWGCGECGSFWIKLENLRKEIEAIVKKYPYRKKSYRKLKGAWQPADPAKEPDDYDERVEAEPMDKAKSFRRG